MYWAQHLAKQTKSSELQEAFKQLAKDLTNNEEKIVQEINEAQGKTIDLEGYYQFNANLLEATMRPSSTFNQILEKINVMSSKEEIVLDDLPKIDGYILKDRIGVGGMANVYSAFKVHDDGRKDQVAIKVVHPKLAVNAQIVKLFIKEAEFCASLSHPNLIETYELGRTTEDVPYMTMELIKGVTMKEVLSKKRKLSAQDSLNIVSKVASALAFLHGQGIFHRDIKPSNIMIEHQSKRVLLIDFGIASKSIDTLDHQASNKVSGTVVYMSPERVRDEHVTGKTDVYSLGICLFVLLTGHPPFISQNHLALRRMHTSKPLPDLPKHLSFLNELLQEMCHKRPEKRLSAISLLGKLHRINKMKELDPDYKQEEDVVKKKKTGIFSKLKRVIKKYY
jgi:serine/threonine protein kinase